MKKDNKKSKYFFRTLFCFFVVFVALLIAYESGYYESRMSNRAVLTKEAMDRFESDVEEGKVVDIEDYLKQPDRNYGNKMSDLGYSISSKIGSGVKYGVDKLFGMLNKMVDE